MEAEFISLLVVSAVALVCPILASLVPNKVIPETVFLLLLGMVVGPNVMGVVQTGDAITLLSDLGLGFLFLLAGYEIDLQELSGPGGRHGLATWFVSFAAALAVGIPVGIWRGNIPGGLAVAIVLTTTAFGTLVPILKDREITGTKIGKCVVEYGVWGEICPILAMALLLSTRATWVTMLLLAIFLCVALAFALVSKRAQRKGSRSFKMLTENAENNSQMTVRATLFLLVALVTLSAIFNLDIVLGAFAAGFVLRSILPCGDVSLEHKLNGLGYGFFIPLFFVVSGAKIDPEGVVDEPLLLVLFIFSLLLIRAVPIFVSLGIRKDTRELSTRHRAGISLYCTTALPLIVAVVSVATSSGALGSETGSVLVAAGGITVLLMPFLASIIMHAIDAGLAKKQQ